MAPYRVSFGSNICIHSGESTTYHIVEQSYHVFGNEPKQDLQNLLTCRMSYPTRTTSLASILSLLFGSGMPTQPDFGVGATKMNTYQVDKNERPLGILEMNGAMLKGSALIQVKRAIWAIIYQQSIFRLSRWVWVGCFPSRNWMFRSLLSLSVSVDSLVRAV